MPPGNCPEGVHEIAWRIIEKAQVAKMKRFRWIRRLRNTLEADWNKYRDLMEEIRQEANGQIAKAKQADEKAGAWLAAMLLTSSDFVDPGDLQVVALNEFGRETFNIIGTPEGDGSLPTAESAHFWSLTKPVDRPIVDPGTCQASITLSQALQKKLWISWTKSHQADEKNFAFCIACPCSDIITATESLDPSEAFESVPRYGHTNPLLANAALHHYRTVHNEHFDSNEDLLRKFGMAGKARPRARR